VIFNSFVNFGFLFLLFFSGCAKQKNKGNLIAKSFDCLKQEAVFCDVAIPINTLPIKDYISETSYAYNIANNVSDIIFLYEKEMEISGWRKLSFYLGSETLLVFEKPHKYAFISIRPHAGKSKSSDVYIFVNLK